MKKVLAFMAALAILIGLIAAFTFTVHQSEYAVVTQFGHIERSITEPGLYMQWPVPVQRVHRFDRRLQLHQGLLMETLTKDKKNVALRCMVVWKISDPKTFFLSVGTMEAAAEKLDDLLTSRGAGALGDFNFDDLISVEREVKIPDLEDRIATELSALLAKGEYGMEIKTVEVDRLALPEVNAHAVYQRMRKERNAIANKYRAEGEEKASEIKAMADLEKAKILSKAYEEAQKTMGEGDALAAEIYAEAYSKDPEFYKFWRSLQSYEKILDEKTTLILAEDSEVLKYLGE